MHKGHLLSSLEDMESTSLNKWLSTFIAETRKVNGEPYPPTTLHLLLCGLQRYMKAVDKERAPNMFAKNDVAFQTLHHTMDSVYRKLRADGVGAQKQSTETFTKEEENQLWACGVLGVDNPTSLLRAVFFNNGKNFCLRGGSEHRNLRLSQLRRTENGYTYTENASKNRSGGLAQLHIKNKSVEIHENPEAGNRCHCRLLDLYISKLPTEAVEKDLFYVCPMEKVNKQPPTYGRSVWYYSIPIGRNKLSQMVPEICKLGLATKQIIVCERQGLLSYMKHKFQKKLYRRGLATVLWSVCVCTNALVTNSSRLCQISYPLIHSRHIMQRWQSSTTKTPQPRPHLDPDLDQTWNLIAARWILTSTTDHRLQSTSPAAVHSVQWQPKVVWTWYAFCWRHPPVPERLGLA